MKLKEVIRTLAKNFEVPIEVEENDTFSTNIDTRVTGEYKFFFHHYSPGPQSLRMEVIGESLKQ